MAGEWQEKELSKLCSYINRGKAPSYIEDSGVLVVNQKCIRNQRLDLSKARRTNINIKPINTERFIYPLDVLVNSTGVGTLGRVAQVIELPMPATVDSHVTIVRPNPKEIEPQYLGFALRFYQPQIEALAEGSTGQTELSRTRLASLVIPVPPLPEQRAIAHILGTLDNKIEINRKNNQTLEDVAQALFKSWFIYFDPVRSKTEGRDTGLPQPIAGLFPDSFEDSELGQVPFGWKVRPLGELTNLTKGVSYSSSELTASDTALVTLKSFARGGGYRPEGLKSFSGSYKANQVVTPGEVVVACTDVTQAAEVVGRPAMVRPSSNYKTLVASLDTLIIRPKDEKLTAAFLYCLCGLNVFTAHTYAHTTGTVVLHLASNAVPSFRLALPSPNLVQAFDKIAVSLLARIQNAEQEGETLSNLRDLLLPKLVSGELRVKYIERIIKRID